MRIRIYDRVLNQPELDFMRDRPKLLTHLLLPDSPAAYNSLHTSLPVCVYIKIVQGLQLKYSYKSYINIISTCMFRHFAHNANRKIEKEVERQRHEEEMKQLRAYLLGHGHDRVHPHILLAPGQCLMSKSKNYFAVVEVNGDFSIYVSSHFCKENRIWSTNTAGKGSLPHQLGIQSDGNVVLYDAHNKPIWDTHTHGKNKGETTLFLDDDGNLILFDAQLNELWSSGTARGKE